MTGPSALSLEETAYTLGQLTGRTLRYEEETIEQAYASRQHFGAPPWEVDTWVGSYEAIAAGEVAETNAALSLLLRKPASDLATYLRARTQLWK
jgi:NAD(P)H dehydrogenase (quinone)